ncbi:hypothetical protein CLOM_g15428 [Closterium sp. NIES-68]|nr:hypothetical protein CLOM_g15428 [Closterium sp. NIES-68]GJP71965.1 hypothetical protein CLOP_g2747 [Closterium sp. NIES-67]
MDSRALLLIVCAAALLTTALADKETIRTFASVLLGVNEVPKNETQAAKNAVGDMRGVGYMRLAIYKDDDGPKWLKYQVTVRRLKGEMPPTKSHVHSGKKGKNGDILLDLPCGYVKKGMELWRCEGSMGKEKRERTAALKAALSKIDKMPADYYGNIHTKRYPDGAVRGQLRLMY